MIEQLKRFIIKNGGENMLISYSLLKLYEKELSQLDIFKGKHIIPIPSIVHKGINVQSVICNDSVDDELGLHCIVLRDDVIVMRGIFGEKLKNIK